MQTFGFQLIRNFLNARLVRNRWKRIRPTRRRFGWVFVAVAMHHVHLFGVAIVRLEYVILQRPLGRDAVFVLDGVKISLPKAKQSRTVHLGRTTDEVMRARLKRLSFFVVPRVFGVVTLFIEDLVGIPVFFFTLEKPAAFEQQDAFARIGQLSNRVPPPAPDPIMMTS